MKLILEHNNAVIREGLLSEQPRSFTLGRSSTCEWRTPEQDDSVSGKHARVARTLFSVYLTDLGTTNGLVVAGSRVKRVRLRPGMRIKLGRCLLRVEKAASSARKGASPYFLLRSGALRKRKLPLPEGSTVIGSGLDPTARAGIALPDPSMLVSGRHAEVVRRPEGCFLRDLQSRNGTFVNGERLKPGTPEKPTERLLRNGDVVGIASREIVFQDGITADARRLAFARLLAFALTLGALVMSYKAVRQATPDCAFHLEESRRAAERLDFPAAREALHLAETAPGVEKPENKTRLQDFSHHLVIWGELASLLEKAKSELTKDPVSEAALAMLRETQLPRFRTSRAWQWHPQASRCNAYAAALSQSDDLAREWDRWRTASSGSGRADEALRALSGQAEQNGRILAELAQEFGTGVPPGLERLLHPPALQAHADRLASMRASLENTMRWLEDLASTEGLVKQWTSAGELRVSVDGLRKRAEELGAPRLARAVTGLGDAVAKLSQAGELVRSIELSVHNLEKVTPAQRQALDTLLGSELLQSSPALEASGVIRRDADGVWKTESTLNAYLPPALRRHLGSDNPSGPAEDFSGTWTVDLVRELADVSFESTPYREASAAEPQIGSQYDRLLGFRTFTDKARGEGDPASEDMEPWLNATQSGQPGDTGAARGPSIYRYADVIKRCGVLLQALERENIRPVDGSLLHGMVKNARRQLMGASLLLNNVELTLKAESNPRSAFIRAGICRILARDFPPGLLNADRKNAFSLEATRRHEEMKILLLTPPAPGPDAARHALKTGLPGMPKFELAWSKAGKTKP